MDGTLTSFKENLGRARSISGLAQALNGLGVGIDISDIHRSAIVLGVSALDHFVHEVCRIGIIRIYEGRAAATEAYHGIKVSIRSTSEGIANPTDSSWLDSSVRSSHSFLTFQHPDKIADAIRLISPIKLWEEVAKELSSDAKAVKVHLTTIVDRRNKIAHEADMDHLGTGERWHIDAAMVNEALDFIEAVVIAIKKLIDVEIPAQAAGPSLHPPGVQPIIIPPLSISPPPAILSSLPPPPPPPSASAIVPPAPVIPPSPPPPAPPAPPAPPNPDT